MIQRDLFGLTLSFVVPSHLKPRNIHFLDSRKFSGFYILDKAHANYGSSLLMCTMTKPKIFLESKKRSYSLSIMIPFAAQSSIFKIRSVSSIKS